MFYAILHTVCKLFLCSIAVGAIPHKQLSHILCVRVWVREAFWNCGLLFHYTIVGSSCLPDCLSMFICTTPSCMAVTLIIKYSNRNWIMVPCSLLAQVYGACILHVDLIHQLISESSLFYPIIFNFA